MLYYSFITFDILTFFCITFDTFMFLQIYWIQFLIAEVVQVCSNGFECYHRINPKSFRECETSVVLWNGDQLKKQHIGFISSLL